MWRLPRYLVLVLHLCVVLRFPTLHSILAKLCFVFFPPFDIFKWAGSLLSFFTMSTTDIAGMADMGSMAGAIAEKPKCGGGGANAAAYDLPLHVAALCKFTWQVGVSIKYTLLTLYQFLYYCLVSQVIYYDHSLIT